MKPKDIFDTLKKQKALWLAILTLLLVVILNVWVDKEGGYIQMSNKLVDSDTNILDPVNYSDDSTDSSTDSVDSSTDSKANYSEIQDYSYRNDKYDQYPDDILVENKDYTATIVTNYGDIVVDLYEERTSMTVNSFVFLAEENFYDGLIFHRVIEDFVIQGGDPLGTGGGGPGYKFEDEVFDDDQFESYVLAMANANQPKTNGSQFFITTSGSASNVSHLAGKHTVFGKITEGFDTVDKIESIKTDNLDKPLHPVIIEDVIIRVK